MKVGREVVDGNGEVAASPGGGDDDELCAMFGTILIAATAVIFVGASYRHEAVDFHLHRDKLVRKKLWGWLVGSPVQVVAELCASETNTQGSRYMLQYNTVAKADGGNEVAVDLATYCRQRRPRRCLPGDLCMAKRRRRHDYVSSTCASSPTSTRRL